MVNHFHMLSVLKVILFFAMVLNFCNAFSQSKVEVVGLVIDKETKEPIPFVHIYTPSLSQGTATNEQGTFLININPLDTLIFSSVGFDKYRFTLTPSEIRNRYEITIELNFKTYQLETVNVTAFKNYESFKKAIVDLNVPNEMKGFKLNIPSDGIYQKNGNSTLTPDISITSPISALYNAFSKEAKEKRKLVSYRKESSEQRIIDARYNIEVVKRLTNLNDDGAKRFMEWCKFEDDYILKASEYDLSIAMLKCLDEYSQRDTIR